MPRPIVRNGFVHDPSCPSLPCRLTNRARPRGLKGAGAVVTTVVDGEAMVEAVVVVSKVFTAARGSSGEVTRLASASVPPLPDPEQAAATTTTAARTTSQRERHMT